MRNVARDALSAFIYAGSHPLKTVRAAIEYKNEGTAYQNWLAGGGANATMVAIDRRYIDAHLYDLEPKTHLLARGWNVVKSPLELLRIMSETMENVTRLGIGVNALKVAQTKAQMQAIAMLTREGTVDFARHGADPFIYNWTRSTAFMNPALQGVDRMVRAFKDNPAGTSAKAIASITIPSVLLWWANKDDPRWAQIPDWKRDLTWVLFTDKWEKPKNMADYAAHQKIGLTKEIDGVSYVNNGYTFTWPKPFELGVLFGSVPERLLDAYVKDNPEAFKDFGKTLANIFSFNVTPTALLPPLQQMTNYNFFTERPLVPDFMKTILPEYQYTPYTTETTKKLGALIGSIPGMKTSSFASPIVIDNYIRGWSGTLGTYAVELADIALRQAGIIPDPIRPAKTLADYPVIRAFMVRFPSAQAQSIQDFRDDYARAKTIVDTVNYLAKALDPVSMRKELELGKTQYVSKIDGIEQSLSQMQQVIQLIDKNPKLSADEKRQIIDTTYLQMIAVARAGNEAIQRIKSIVDAQQKAPPASPQVTLPPPRRIEGASVGATAQ